MKIGVGEAGGIVLWEVFEGIVFKRPGIQLGVRMRDLGFEITTQSDGFRRRSFAIDVAGRITETTAAGGESDDE